MTQDEIIRMAREAGVSIRGYYDETGSTPQELERFAALVATYEREKQAEQEPVAIIEKEAGFETEVYATGYADSLPDGVFKLYTAPLRTKDLTDEELMACRSSDPAGGSWLESARSVIAADREKNK